MNEVKESNYLQFFLPGKRLPSLNRPRLIHVLELRSKNSTNVNAGSASDDPPATITPSFPLTRAFTHECCEKNCKFCRSGRRYVGKYVYICKHTVL